jgi:hypothetical protein
MESLFGSHLLLAKLPLLWSAGIMVAIFVLFVWAGRMITEGLGYNTSFASQVGDLFLIIYILIGANMLQRGVPAPTWTTSWRLHGIIVVLAVVVWFNQLGVKAPMFVDRAHNVIIVPLFVYFILSLAPVILWSGTAVEVAGAVGCIVVWLALMAYDHFTGRLDQQRFLYMNYGIRLKAWEGKFYWLPSK